MSTPLRAIIPPQFAPGDRIPAASDVVKTSKRYQFVEPINPNAVAPGHTIDTDPALDDEERCCHYHDAALAVVNAGRQPAQRLKHQRRGTLYQHPVLVEYYDETGVDITSRTPEQWTTILRRIQQIVTSATAKAIEGEKSKKRKFSAIKALKEKRSRRKTKRARGDDKSDHEGEPKPKPSLKAALASA